MLLLNGRLITDAWFYSGLRKLKTKREAHRAQAVAYYLQNYMIPPSFIVDVMKNGVTLFTTSANRPTIAIAGNASTIVLPDILTVAVGDRLRIDVIQVGSTIARERSQPRSSTPFVA